MREWTQTVCGCTSVVDRSPRPRNACGGTGRRDGALEGRRGGAQAAEPHGGGGREEAAPPAGLQVVQVPARAREMLEG